MLKHGFRGVILAGTFAGAAFAQFQIPSSPVDLPQEVRQRTECATHVDVKQALQVDPTMQIAISDRVYFAGLACSVTPR